MATLMVTTMMTNSVEVHREVGRQREPGSHRHVQPMGGKAAKAAIYAAALCRAVCSGTCRQMRIDAQDLVPLKCKVAALVAVDGVPIDAAQQDPDDNCWMKSWDDTNGKSLRTDLVKAARRDKIEEIRQIQV